MIEAFTSVCTCKSQKKYLDNLPWKWMLSTVNPYSNKRLKTWPDLKNGYAIDNGAYSNFLNGVPFQEKKFLQLLDDFGEAAQWVVIPDVVCDKNKTLELADKWIPKLPFKKLMVAQNGMETSDFDFFKDKIDGVFIGGDTDWKFSTLKSWSKWAIDNKKICHVGRINSVRMIKLCIDANATSFDGSGPARFLPTARRMTHHLLMIKNQVKLFP